MAETKCHRLLFAALACCGPALLFVAEIDVAWAQVPPIPRIWDVELDAHVRDLPRRVFVRPACGSNGGPPGLVLESFDEFARCAPETATGFREIWFSYDDEAEYIARATRSEALIQRNLANQVAGVNGGAKLVHPGGAKLVHLTLCGTRCWGVVPVVHRRDPRCFE